MACLLPAIKNPQLVSNDGNLNGHFSRCVAALPGSGGKFVQVYRDNSADATAVVGTVASDGSITYGTPVAFTEFEELDICAVGADKVVIVYKNAANDPESIVGTISGTSISFGSTQTVDTLSPYDCRIAADPSTGKLLWTYGAPVDSRAVAGDISGTTVTWGSPYSWHGARRRTDIDLIAIGSNKFLYADSGSGNNQGAAVIFSVSGTTVTDGTEHQFSTDRAADPSLAWDSDNSKALVVYYDSGGLDVNYRITGKVLSISGTTITSGSSELIVNDTNNIPVSSWSSVTLDPVSGAFVVAVLMDPSDANYWIGIKAATIIGTTVDFCPDDLPTAVVEDPVNDFTSNQSLDITDNGNIIIGWHDGDQNIYGCAIQMAQDIEYGCDVKPTRTIVTEVGTPGVPGFPGQAAVPARFIPGYCQTITIQNVSTPNGDYEYRCVTGPSEESLAIGFPEDETFCSMTPVVIPQSDDPYAPNYDPNYDQDAGDSGSASGIGINTTVRCFPWSVQPAIPYIPPSTPSAPTPTLYAINYNLGWNHDVLIGTGSDVSFDVTDENVQNDSAGIAVGFSNLASWGLSGIGKFPVFVLFEGDRVSVFLRGSRVWGQAIRAVSDVFTLKQNGAQVAVLRNDIEIYKADVLSGGPVAAGAIIYKGGDHFCLPLPGEADIFYPSGPLSGYGDAEIELPAFEAIGYEGDYGVGDVTLPGFGIEASTGNHGAGDIDLPFFYAFAADHATGWALTVLPAPEVAGYTADTLSGYATVSLPGFSAVGADASGYGFGDTALPPFTASGSGDFAIPTAAGADVDLPHFMLGATGLTGGVGGSDVDLPAFDAVGADRLIYGEVDTRLPAFYGFGGELPVYSGVLDGYFQPLEMSQGWGVTYSPNTLDGSIDGLDGELWGGAYLNQDIAGLEVVTMTGTVTNVGRLDGTFLPMEMNSTGLVGSYGEVSGTLGSPLEGNLFGGAFIDGTIPGLVGDLAATLGVVGRLDGSFPAMTGSLLGTVLGIGGAEVTLPAIRSLWGIIDGYLPGLSGELVQTAITVQDHTAWVMNMKTGAISRYPAYAFNFLCRFNDGNYIVREDGIYRIGGEYDVDQSIDAGFSLPSTDMGISTQKIAPRLYMQGRLDGQFAVTTMADELDPVRSVSIIRPGVGYHRCKLPRGIRGTHLEFDVDNVSGADFEIEQVDVLVADSGRKV